MFIFLFGALFFVVSLIWFFSERPAPVQLKGSHVIITGGSSGIGLTLAKQLALKGANVTIIARDKKKLDDAENAINEALKDYVGTKPTVLKYSADVTNFEVLDKAIVNAVEKHGRVDVLVTSAGDTRPERFDDMDIKYYDQIMRVNYLGSIYATKSVIPFMQRQKRGRVVYVSSLLGLFGYPAYGVYSASKFALRGLAESLHLEYCPWNITFSISVPPNVNTPMFENEEKIKPPETKALEGEHQVYPPEVISQSIVDSLQSYRFIIPYGMDAHLVSLVTGGFSPGSFLEVLSQTFGSGILRMVSIFYLWTWKNTVKKHRRVEE